MQSNYFDQFALSIKSLTQVDLRDEAKLRARLRIASAGDLEVCYAPMEHVNTAAKVVLVGITPGMTQLVNSVSEMRRQLLAGSDRDGALRAAKATGAFSGSMRPNLIRLLDAIGLNGALRIGSCASLFGEHSGLVQTTSVLRNPVFLRGGNYNGTPSMAKTPLLREQMMRHFAEDAQRWRNAVFVPLGDKAADGLNFLSSQGVVSMSQVLAGLPHPSGANAERIAYFLGTKARLALSPKTDPGRLDLARTQLRTQTRGLRLTA